MFNKILIANRGDQPLGGAAAQLNRMARTARAEDLTPMEKACV